MKVILFGSTGMVGQGILYECIDHPEVDSILLVNRRSLQLTNPKVKEVILYDLAQIQVIREDLKGYDACFYAMGISSLGMKEEEYRKLMFDVPVKIAKELYDLNPQMVFCFVTGKGTDPNSKIMWARVKGAAEIEILSMGFKDAYMFRPGHIQPMRGIRSRTKWYNIYYAVLGKFYWLLKRVPSFATDTITIGRAMICVVKEGYSKKILESEDINKMGRKG